jgi:crotonobetainyl-CoA:carnitine CoA-transferase CaiB-like acyl-CoA transferase
VLELTLPAYHNRDVAAASVHPGLQLFRLCRTIKGANVPAILGVERHWQQEFNTEFAMASTALVGVKILDLSRVLAAPLATQLLGDLGAEVIKVERPGAGDEAREYGPPFLMGSEGRPTADSAFFLSCNRNKKSVTVDLARPEGQEIVGKLASQSDALVENFKTGGLKKYGLDYESLRAVNPSLIYCSVTGFGQTGPYAHKPGYDGVFQAMSGFMSVSGHPDHMPGGGPMKAGISIVDILTSFYAAVAILSALHHRDVNGGRGQYIDLALLDSGIASLSHYAMSYLVSGELPKRRGNGGFGGIPSQAFACADGQIFLVASNNTMFRRFCAAIGCPTLAADPRFAATADRIASRDALIAILAETFKSRTVAEWLSLLDEADIPASPVNDFAAALKNEQVKHREMLVNVEHPAAGTIPLLRNPIRYSETPIESYSAPPLAGQHTSQILQRLGYDEAAIASLRSRNIV